VHTVTWVQTVYTLEVLDLKHIAACDVEAACGSEHVPTAVIANPPLQGHMHARVLCDTTALHTLTTV
jgi:hypothetical protein